jgi:hypothetical protein
MECVTDVVAIVSIELRSRSDDPGLHRKPAWPTPGGGNIDPADVLDVIEIADVGPTASWREVPNSAYKRPPSR